MATINVACMITSTTGRDEQQVGKAFVCDICGCEDENDVGHIVSLPNKAEDLRSSNKLWGRVAVEGLGAKKPQRQLCCDPVVVFLNMVFSHSPGCQFSRPNSKEGIIYIFHALDALVIPLQLALPSIHLTILTS